MNAPKAPAKSWQQMTDSERRIAARQNAEETQKLMGRICPAHLRPDAADAHLSEAGRCFKTVRSILRK